MNFRCVLYYVCLSAMCIFTHEIHSLRQLQPLRREIRFSKFDLHFSNESIGMVLKCSVQNFPDKQTMSMHFIVYKNITKANMIFTVSKCKDYYVDCINVESYEVTDSCSKLYMLVALNKSENSKQQMINKCPIFGEYYYNNLTFLSDKFGSVYSSLSPRWWESYWKIHIKFYNTDRTYLAFLNMEFYFLQLRSRNHKH